MGYPPEETTRKYSLIDLFDLNYVPANLYKNITILLNIRYYNLKFSSLQDDKYSKLRT